MPVVHIETVGDLTKNQKAELIRKVTLAVVDVTGKPAESVYVRIETVPGEEFGIGGQQLG